MAISKLTDDEVQRLCEKLNKARELHAWVISNLDDLLRLACSPDKMVTYENEKSVEILCQIIIVLERAQNGINSHKILLPKTGAPIEGWIEHRKKAVSEAPATFMFLGNTARNFWEVFTDVCPGRILISFEEWFTAEKCGLFEDDFGLPQIF